MAYQSVAHSTAVVRPPSHPVPRLQAPFEESMAESVIDDTDIDMFLDPVSRRNHLLEAPVYTRAVAGRWKQKPGEKYHPLWKLIAQISFGIHLLAEGLARSEDEVMQILQSHVDEIDGFLERTTEDFDLAQEDIQERLRCLKLPLSHPATFDKMLEDRNFRLSIVNGNEKIEHIVERTSQAMKDSLKDVQKGFDSTSCLETYLKELAQNWMRQSIEHEAVFVAMQGNVEGWRKAFMSLHIQGSHLGGSLKKLTDIINEMQKRAGEVSRRLLHQARGYSSGPDARLPQHRLTTTGRSTPTSRFAPNKDLPRMPSRPSLQAAGSQDSIRADLPTRTSSSDTFAHLSQLSRSATPQYELPMTKNVKISPVVTQGAQAESGRVQSMTPSVSDSRSSVQSTSTTIKSRSTDDEEPPERYFPPVELPAHVPEETLSKAPMSKQNRLSVVLNPALANGGEKISRTPGSTLIGLLKSNHILSKSSATNTRLTPTSSTEKLQAQPAAQSSDVNGQKDFTLDKVEPSSVFIGTRPTARSATTIRSLDSLHGKSNKRKPKKGVKHWFDALDDDTDDDDKICMQEDNTSQAKITIFQPVEKPHIEQDKEDNSPQIKTTTVQVAEKPRTDHNNVPGTPAWASTKFATPEIRREDFRFGAFGSHPPELPPGSPPLAEGNMPNPFDVVQPQHNPPESPSTATAVEEGPEVVASTTNRSLLGLRPASDSVALRRKSTIAPEVVSVEKSSKMPVRSLQFVAEMEGSTPFGSTAFEMPDASVLELEAPQQYFKLPPRPHTTDCSPMGVTKSSSEHLAQPSKVKQEAVESDLVLRSRRSQPCSETADGAETAEAVESAVASAGNLTPVDIVETNNFVDEPTNSNENLQTQLLLPAKKYMPTPQIPLPPSPLDTEVPLPSIAEDQAQEETANQGITLLLPAVAYKAPLSEEQILSKVFPDHTALSSKEVELPSTNQQTTTRPAILMDVTTQATLCAEMPVPGVSPTATTFTEFVARGAPAEDTTRHARSRSSHGSHNGWKAFFTGQPSPAGSSLSIRSMKRESAGDIYDNDHQSPVLRNSNSAGVRISPSSDTNIVRNFEYVSRPFDDEKEAVPDIYGEQDRPSTIGLGLGIHAITVQQD